MSTNYLLDSGYAQAFSDGCDYFVREIKQYRLNFHYTSKERRVLDNLINYLEKNDTSKEKE
jgi:hypothetical protein